MPRAKPSHSGNKQTVADPLPEGDPCRNPDGSLNKEKLLDLLADAPGTFDLLMIDEVIASGDIGPEYHQITEEVVEALVEIIIQAASGDEVATNQFKAIQKFVRPEKYELPATKIKEIAEKYETRPQLARGWEIRRLMSGLSFVVEPVRADKPSPNSPVRLIDEPKSAHSPYYWERAHEHWKTNCTLQSLAIRVYLSDLRKAGITGDDQTITERSLKRDLEEVRKFEQVANEEVERRRGHWYGRSFHGSPSIEWYEFSEGWKDRKKKAKTKTEKRVSNKRKV